MNAWRGRRHGWPSKGNKVDLTMFEKEDIPKVGEMVFF